MISINCGLTVERVKSVEQFHDYYLLKCDPNAVAWSGFASEPQEDVLRAHFQKLLHSNKFVMLFRYGCKVIGYCQLSQNDDFLEIDGYSVLSEYSGRGFGKAIIKYMSSPDSYDNITVSICKWGGEIAWVSELNIASLKCFLSNGFEIVSGKEKLVELKALKRTDKFVLLRKIW